MNNAELKLKIEKFDRSLIQEHHHSISYEQNTDFLFKIIYGQQMTQIQPMKKDTMRPDIDDYDEETYDLLIDIYLKFSKGGILESVRITKMK